MADATGSWYERLRGRFVVFDGPDGCGKTTQARRFGALARQRGVAVCEVREPGGTVISEKIRQVLLDPSHDAMDVRCEMLLYMASRAQLVSERIGPALAEGKLVLADRFISSTLAYQGAAGGLDRKQIIEVGRIAVGDHWPDLVVIFDVDPQTAAERIGASPKQRHKNAIAVSPTTLFSDRMEIKGDDFHRRVREGYLQQVKADPERHLLIDARGSEEAVFERLLKAMEHWGDGA